MGDEESSSGSGQTAKGFGTRTSMSRGIPKSSVQTRGGIASSFLSRNSGAVAPSTGMMTRDEVNQFLDYLISDVDSLNDVSTADKDELIGELLLVLIFYGGEERALIDGRSVKLMVGGSERSMKLGSMVNAATKLRLTVRAFSRAFTPLVKEMMLSAEVQDYFTSFYGAGGDPMSVRSDLIHKYYSHKYNGEMIEAVRARKLKRVTAGDGASGLEEVED